MPCVGLIERVGKIMFYLMDSIVLIEIWALTAILGGILAQYIEDPFLS